MDAAARALAAAGAALEAAHPGTMFEGKPRGFGLHFRLAPEAGPAIHDALAALIADRTISS